MKTCETCRYWQKSEKELKQGECRINPPSATPIPSQQGVALMSYYPVTAPDNWCGQHKAGDSITL